MDAVKYLKEIARMCAEYALCNGCPAGRGVCKTMEEQEPEKIVAIVEEWAKEHPVETRQSGFLKEFPNAIRTTYGAIGICPQYVDQDIKCGETGCADCKEKYWSEEIEDGGN